MNRITEMADELATEVLSEAAETFFGQRKSLEEELEHFHRRASQLQEMGRRAEQLQNVLHGVLLSEHTVRDLYRTLELPEPKNVEFSSKEEIARHVSRQRAWTLHGRFYKLLAAVYSQMQPAVAEYMHGGYRTDPDHPKKKIAVIGCRELREWAERLNRNVNKLNTEQSPNEVLHFVKSLDGETCARERAAGASCEIGRDRGLLYTCIDFTALCLPDFPEYPPLARIAKKLRRFARTTCAESGRQVRVMFQELEPHWQGQ